MNNLNILLPKGKVLEWTIFFNHLGYNMVSSNAIPIGYQWTTTSFTTAYNPIKVQFFDIPE